MTRVQRIVKRLAAFLKVRLSFTYVKVPVFLKTSSIIREIDELSDLK